MKRTLLLACTFALSHGHAHAQKAAGMAHFMTMNICTKGDAIDPDHAPGEPGCTHMRPIRDGEIPPYFLTNFPSHANHCPDGGGPIAKINIPIKRGDTTRIVSLYSHRPEDTACHGPGTSDKIGASIEWHDAEYGFIMGSWSPVGLSNFLSPLCEKDPTRSSRFFRGWVLGPTRSLGAGGQVFQSKLAVGKADEAAAACPAKYHPGYTAWRPTDFTYTSGATLNSIISDHYASAAKDQNGPGKSEQLERTYWTREYGLTRWEKWARDDWHNPRSGMASQALASTLGKTGTCSKPWGMPETTPPGLARHASTPTELHTDPVTGERHLWYMTLCDDYSHIVHHPADRLTKEADEAASPAFWH